MLWTKVYSGNGKIWGNCIQQTSDGGYIFTGYTGNIPGASKYLNVWLIKVAPDPTSI